MARLESQAKLGFYPTPDHLLPVIASYISPATVPANFLDPCCGEAEALHLMGLMLSASTYGIELDKGRGIQAQKAVNSLILSDAMRTKVSDKSFSLLFLNPPYDWAVREEGEKTERVERQFLVRFTQKLVDNGILVFIVPHYTLIKSSTFLSNWYEDIRAYKFPPEDYEVFKQVVLFGRKKSKSIPDEFLRHRLQAIEKGEIDIPALSMQDTQSYTLPASQTPQFFFSMDVEEEEAAELVSRSLLWQDFWKELDPTIECHPIMPLRKGHLALLLAAGYLDGRLTSQGYDLVLKGKTKRVTQRTEEVDVDDKGKEVKIIKEIEKVEVGILALELQTGKFQEIK
ncbi:MAG: DUF6094 domain-containing protein [Thermodesulfobacteriota bacterium]